MRCVKLSAAKNALLAAAAILALCGAANAQEPTIQRTEFKIEAATLSEALQAFGRQSGKAVMYSEETVAGLSAPSVIGSYTNDEALSRLLYDSGLEIIEATGGNYVIKPRQLADPTLVTETGGGLSSSAAVSDQVIVTGTNIRGIAPDSSPMITFKRSDIERSGFQSTEQFIRSIPQNFGGGATNLSVRAIPDDVESLSNINAGGSAINLRGLGGSATLTLLNGRRLSPSGSTINFVDISTIPISAIERIEILADGASAIYGADAIAGVVNIVLRDDYDSMETSINYGSVTEGTLNQVRASQSLGTSWKGGHGLLAYEIFDQDELFAEEKSFSKNARLHPYTLIPEQKRHSLTGALRHRISDRIESRIDALATFKETDSSVSLLNTSIAQITNNQDQVIINPTLYYSLWGDWELMAGGNFSYLNSYTNNSTIDIITREPVIDATISRGKYAQYSLEAVADGALLALPGGVSRLAFGAAFRKENASQTNSANVRRSADREVWSIFGELFFPIVGEGNRTSGIERLELNISARHSDFSDFGSSTNPKVGLVWSPISRLVLRSSYGTSFNPPSLTLAAIATQNVIQNLAYTPGTDNRNVPFLILSGQDAFGLAAETSKAYSAGFDFDTEILKGQLSVSSTYYDISFRNRIDAIPLPPGFSTFRAQEYRDQFSEELYIDNPTVEIVNSLYEQALMSGGQVRNFIPPSFGNVEQYSFVFDLRQRNLASTDTDGLDFSINYSRPGSFGDLTFSVAGNYILSFVERLADDAPSVDGRNRIFHPVDLRLRGSVGWSYRDWSLFTFVNYTDDYFDDRTNVHSEIEAWTTIDFNVSYSFADRGILSGTAISLQAINIFDADPPFVASDETFDRNGITNTFYDPTNANPLGRFISVQFTKQW